MTDFEAIYAQYYEPVYRYVLSLCRSEQEAEDLTQEAFYRALEHLGQFRGECSLYVWLCQIAKNTYFTREKKRRRQSPLVEDAPDTTGDPVFALADRESAWRLHRLLHALDEPYKEVFSLRVFGELSFSQIGELFGKTDSWARLVFYRAKTRLGKELSEHEL